MTQLQETVEQFTCEGDDLLGIRHHPANPASPIGVLVVVGGPQYRVGSHRQFVLLARALARGGFDALRFDYRGMGDGAGSARSFEHVASDLRAAVDHFYSLRPGLRGIVVFGLCDAASAALMYSHSDSRVAGLILVNPWVRTEAGAAAAYVQHYYAGRLLQWQFWHKLFGGKVDMLASLADFIRKLLSARAAVSPDDTTATGDFIDRMRDGAGRFHRPVLLLLSGTDLTAREFESLCQQDSRWSQWQNSSSVRLIRLPGADHTFSSRVDLDASNAEILAWLVTNYGAAATSAR